MSEEPTEAAVDAVGSKPAESPDPFEWHSDVVVAATWLRRATRKAHNEYGLVGGNGRSEHYLPGDVDPAVVDEVYDTCRLALSGPFSEEMVNAMTTLWCELAP